MSHFSIAGLQLAVSCGDNRARISDEIVDCKTRFPWVDMIVIGELASFGPEKKYAEQFATAEQFYRALAKRLNIWLIPGSHYEQADGNIYNTASVINPQGEIVCRHRKLFPFYPYESGVEAGQDFVVFDVPQGRIGVAICYDLWFPEVSRSLVCKGAEVLIYPTMTGTIDRNAEVTLSKATAIMNQCYVLGINTAGELGNGLSVFIGPEGDVIYQAGAQEEVMPIEIDFATVRRNRQRGIHGLGQPLKSFRDNSLQYPAYPAQQTATELDKLGPLTMPTSTANNINNNNNKKLDQ